MDPAPPPAASRPPADPQPAVLTAWPRSAQRATALLLGLASVCLIARGLACGGWGSRPTELRPGEALTYRIDLNRAGRVELLQVPGVGETLARRILDYRGQNGGFRSVDELDRVEGIGLRTLERLRPWVCVHADDRDEGSGPTVETSLPARPAGERASPRKAEGLTTLVNVNEAPEAELERLPGIGPTLAKRIVEERRKGPFKSVEELRRVRGIGPKTVEKLRDHVTTGPGPAVVTAGD